MKSSTVKMMTVFLVMAIFCIITQEFAIHLLYDQSENLRSKYKQLAMSKAQNLCVPYNETQQGSGTLIPIDPHDDAASLSVKNKNPLNIKKLDNGEKWEGQIGVDKQGHAIFSSWEYGMRAGAFTLRAYAQDHNVDTIDKLVGRFSEAKGEQFEVYVLFLCKNLAISRNEKINLIQRMPELLRAMSRYESGVELPNELFISYDVLERIEREEKK